MHAEGAREAGRPSPPAALALAVGWGVAGALPLALGAPDARATLAWLALIAAPAGCQLGAAGVRAWPHAFAAPGVWMVELALADAERSALVGPAWVSLALCGLFALGLAAGSALRGRTVGRGGGALAGWGTAGGLLLAGAALTGLGVAGGPGRLLGGRTPGELGPAVAARLLDLSPVALVAECAGLDWMRDPAVYVPAGTEWFSDRRRPYRGILAGPTLLLVGCALLFAARRRARLCEDAAPARE